MKIDEKALTRISLAGAVAGMVLLYIISGSLEIRAYRIGELSPGMTGRLVNVTGNVSDIYVHRNGHVFLTLSDGTGSVKVVLWSSIVKALEDDGLDIRNLDRGVQLQVTGELSLYRGELEIAAKKPDVRIVNRS